MNGLTRSLVLGGGASGVSIAPAALPTASIPAGTFLRDPATGLIYGQSDGAGGYDPLGGSVVSSEYRTHFFAPGSTGVERRAWATNDPSADGVFQTNLSAATAWATAGFLTQPNPSVASELSLVTFPSLAWDWSAGDSLFIFWAGRGTPEGTDQSAFADAASAAANGIKLQCTTTGKAKLIAYQAVGSTFRSGGTSSSTVFETSVTHTFGVCLTPVGHAYWVDGVREPAFSSGYVAMSGGGLLSTVTGAPLYLGGDGSTSASVQNGIALQTRAFVVLAGRRGRTPAIADIDALVLALHRNQQALVSSDAW